MPAIPIPLNQPPKSIILALINRDNLSSFTLSQVDLDTVTAMPQGYARNTSIRVIAIPGGGFKPSSKVVYFNRLSLAYQWRNTVPVAPADSPVDTLSLLPAINALYGINLTSDDVVNNPYTTSPHTVVAKTTSLVWIGQTDFVVVPSIETSSITLTEEFSDAGDPGLVYDIENDYNKPTQEVIYEMLSSMTGTANPYSALSFSISAVVDLMSGVSGITLTANPNTGFSGSYYLTYDRIYIEDLIASSTISMSVFTAGGYSIGNLVPASFIKTYLSTLYDVGFVSSDLAINNFVLALGYQITLSSTVTNYLIYGTTVITVVA